MTVSKWSRSWLIGYMMHRESYHLTGLYNPEPAQLPDKFTGPCMHCRHMQHLAIAYTLFNDPAIR